MSSLRSVLKEGKENNAKEVDKVKAADAQVTDILAFFCGVKHESTAPKQSFASTC